MTDHAAIDRSCMRDKIRALVVGRILSGEYPPGMRVKEMTLAAECRVSQAPVREALRELEALGVLSAERYRGACVRAVDTIELREAYELRALIEERSAQLAAPIDAAAATRLRACLDDAQGALADHDSNRLADAIIGFHRAIVEASGNRAFLQSWDSLHLEVRVRFVIRLLNDTGIINGDFIARDHKIVAALEQGDGHTAGGLLRQGIGQVIAALDR